MINPNLSRGKANAVLNNDVASLNKYKKERALYRKVSKLSSEVEDIKSLLTTISDRLENIEKS